ncbi:MAG: hypothetical protein R3C40_01215 [Parvularculaceae bacterium]
MSLQTWFTKLTGSPIREKVKLMQILAKFTKIGLFGPPCDDHDAADLNAFRANATVVARELPVRTF